MPLMGRRDDVTLTQGSLGFGEEVGILRLESSWGMAKAGGPVGPVGQWSRACRGPPRETRSAGAVPKHTRRPCCPSKPATPGGPRSPSLCPVPCLCLPQGPSVFCLPVSLSASSRSLCLPSLLPLAPLQFSLALYPSTVCLTVSLLLPICPFLSPPSSLLPLSPRSRFIPLVSFPSFFSFPYAL